MQVLLVHLCIQQTRSMGLPNPVSGSPGEIEMGRQNQGNIKVTSAPEPHSSSSFSCFSSPPPCVYAFNLPLTLTIALGKRVCEVFVSKPKTSSKACSSKMTVVTLLGESSKLSPLSREYSVAWRSGQSGERERHESRLGKKGEKTNERTNEQTTAPCPDSYVSIGIDAPDGQSAKGNLCAAGVGDGNVLRSDPIASRCRRI